MSKDKLIFGFLVLIVAFCSSMLISIHFEKKKINIEFENKKIRLEEKYVRRRDSANRIFEERIQHNTKVRDSLEEVLNGKK